MNRTINISLNVPPIYRVDELTRQLTEYGELLIARKVQETDNKKKCYPHESLRGLMKRIDATPKELVEEYLQEKYNV